MRRMFQERYSYSRTSGPMSIPGSEVIVPPPLGPPRHLADGSKNGDFAGLPSIKATVETATSIRSIRIKNRNSHKRVTPSRNAPQESTEVHLECKSKIQVSYTISEDMSGNCKKNILSRISQKKRDSKDVRLRIGSSYADSWSLRDRRVTAEGHNRGVASSRSASPRREPAGGYNSGAASPSSVSPHVASRASPQTVPYQNTQQQTQSNQAVTPPSQADFQAQQQAIHNVLLQNIQSQTGPLTGWRGNLSITVRLSQAWQYVTQLLTANPNNAQQDVQHLCTLALNFEKGAFDIASNRDAYLKLMRDKFEQLQAARNQISQKAQAALSTVQAQANATVQEGWVSVLRSPRGTTPQIGTLNEGGSYRR